MVMEILLFSSITKDADVHLPNLVPWTVGIDILGESELSRCELIVEYTGRVENRKGLGPRGPTSMLEVDGGSSDGLRE
jgi:hypothetical protein